MILFKFVLFAVIMILVSSKGLYEEFTWTRISYVWPKNELDPTRHQRSIPSRYAKGFFNSTLIVEEERGNSQKNSTNSINAAFNYKFGCPKTTQLKNNIPMGSNVWKNKLFITLPRRKLDVPSTLNYIMLDNPEKHNVPLIPYPSWNENLYPDPSGKDKNIVSVYRTAIDLCDRMWFVDTGVVETLILGTGNPTKIKPITLMIINLNTDKVILEYPIPSDVLKPKSGIVSITVDVTENTCDDAFAYMPDLGGIGVIVYSFKQNKSWRVDHNYFYLESTKGEFFISGRHFQWDDGVFSLQLTEMQKDGFRDMYFHSLAGTHIFKVSTNILRNETLATRSYHQNDFKIVGDRSAGFQTSMADIHQQTGIMFMNLVNQNALGCWNTNKSLNTISLIQKDDQNMIYPSDVKNQDDKIYVLTNNMIEFLFGKLDYDTINFRIWTNTVKDATTGTQCVFE